MSGTRARISSRSPVASCGRWARHFRMSDRMNSRSSIRFSRNSRRASSLSSSKASWTTLQELPTSTSVPSMSKAASLSTFASGDRVRLGKQGGVGPEPPGREVLRNLLRSAGAEDGGGPLGPQPVERQRGHRKAGPVGQLLELSGARHVVRPPVAVKESLGEPTDLGGGLPPVQEPTLKEPPGEGGIRLDQDMVFPAELPDRLRVPPIEEVEPDLVHGDLRLGQPVDRLGQLLEAEVGDPNRPDPARLPELLERRERLLERGLGVGGVDEVEIDARPTEPLQALGQRGADLVGAQVLPGDLGRDERLAGERRGSFQRLPEKPFRTPVAVD